MPKCRCIFKHAITKEERAQAKDRLKYSREVRDTTGIMLALASLQPCPAKK